jgi:hypothetical protein
MALTTVPCATALARETVVESSIAYATSGVARPLAAEIDKLPLMTIEESYCLSFQLFQYFSVAPTRCKSYVYWFCINCFHMRLMLLSL